MPDISVPSSPKDVKPKQPIYEYLPPTLDMRADLELMQGETAKEKFMRKFSEQPLVPIGCLCTAVALSYGVYQMKTGNSAMSQRMMRLRILAQGFTVVACLAGVMYSAKKKTKPAAVTEPAVVSKS